jgi:hypothetical protein
MVKIKRTNNDHQNITHKSKDRVTQTPGRTHVLRKGNQFIIH